MENTMTKIEENTKDVELVEVTFIVSVLGLYSNNRWLVKINKNNAKILSDNLYKFKSNIDIKETKILVVRKKKITYNSKLNSDIIF